MNIIWFTFFCSELDNGNIEVAQGECDQVDGQVKAGQKEHVQR